MQIISHIMLTSNTLVSKLKKSQNGSSLDGMTVIQFGTCLHNPVKVVVVPLALERQWIGRSYPPVDAYRAP